MCVCRGKERRRINRTTQLRDEMSRAEMEEGCGVVVVGMKTTLEVAKTKIRSKGKHSFAALAA